MTPPKDFTEIENSMQEEGASPRSTPAEERSRFKRPCVTIFGAGITGLTVAHELVERGFRVQVWECQPDERRPERGCDIGGMARTQWCRADWPESYASSEGSETSYPGEKATAIEHIPQRLAWRRGKSGLTGYDRYGGASDVESVAQVVLDTLGGGYGSSLYAEVVYTTEGGRRTSKDAVWPAACKALQELFKKLVPSLKLEPTAKIAGQPPRQVCRLSFMTGGDKPQKRTLVIVPIPLTGNAPARGEIDAWIGFRWRERWLPGEHGYRFFPAFYHHLFDTMQRTPVLDPIAKSEYALAQERTRHDKPDNYRYVETGKTAYDSLTPASKQVLAGDGRQRSATLPRYLVPTLEGLRSAVENLLRPAKGVDGQGSGENGYGLYPRDIARLYLKIFQFLSSCEERRTELSQVSWASYVGTPISKELESLLERLPRALVSMSSAEIDVHSYAQIAAQLLLDQVKPSGFRDGVLNGPTSEAWLSHWRRYLEAQGVEFIFGKLVGFKAVEEMPDVSGARKTIGRIKPDVQCFDPRYGSFAGPPLLDGYWVLALPVIEAQKMARVLASLPEKPPPGYLEPGDPAPSRDLRRLAEWNLAGSGGSDSEGELAQRLRNGFPDETALRHMCGIQYFFAEDVYWVNGHVLYLTSRFGLTSVSQARFWQDKSDWEHGYRGVLSVIITDWQVTNGQDPWKLTPDQLAREVWHEIQTALVGRKSDKARLADYAIPAPLYWHLDRNLAFQGVGYGYENASPFLINRPGDWEGRPGEVGPKQGYSVYENIVFAGIYMKTHTRVNCMETANESGRHAVNAIVREQRLRKQPVRAFCDIWPLAAREVSDLRVLRELDAKLYAENCPHFLDILEVDRGVSEWVPGQAGPLDKVLNPILDGLR